MKEQEKNKQNMSPAQFDKQAQPTQVDRSAASGRWGSVHRIRLPHKNGLPLSSGGCGDAIER